eukprot:8965895-Lingulodinium_polyedra.AAC.1
MVSLTGDESFARSGTPLDRIPATELRQPPPPPPPAPPVRLDDGRQPSSAELPTHFSWERDQH